MKRNSMIAMPPRSPWTAVAGTRRHRRRPAPPRRRPRLRRRPRAGAVQNQTGRALRATRAGDVWIWHNRDGWHLRLRHQGSTKLTFTGTIKSNDGKALDVRGFRLEKKHGDMFSVSADKTTVTFLFNNYGGFDGIDLNMHCSASVTFSLSAANAVMNPDRIHLGKARIAAFTSPVTIDRRK